MSDQDKDGSREGVSVRFSVPTGWLDGRRGYVAVGAALVLGGGLGTGTTTLVGGQDGQRLEDINDVLVVMSTVEDRLSDVEVAVEGVRSDVSDLGDEVRRSTDLGTLLLLSVKPDLAPLVSASESVDE